MKLKLLYSIILALFVTFSLVAQQKTEGEKNFKYVLHKAGTRGQTDAGWLSSKHTFSFNNYYEPDRMNFGTLRVLNDDKVAGGRGFGMHPHENMEIISIALEGSIEHKDNMGNSGVIKEGDVQIMSAGTGIRHSEFNHSKTDTLKFLQIWVIPNKANVKPRYQQYNGILKNIPTNTFKKVVAPDDDKAVFLYQNAIFSIGEFNKLKKVDYPVAFKGNGVYAFILEGSAKVNGIAVGARDGIGIWNTDIISIEATDDLKILLMDVPMID